MLLREDDRRVVSVPLPDTFEGIHHPIFNLNRPGLVMGIGEQVKLIRPQPLMIPADIDRLEASETWNNMILRQELGRRSCQFKALTGLKLVNIAIDKVIMGHLYNLFSQAFQPDPLLIFSVYHHLPER